MKPIEVQLLDSLGAGVHPFELPADPIGTGRIDFDALLAGAIDGKPKTELGVVFGPMVSGSYLQSEQRRIARGVDLAAAAGVDHALVLHDEQTLRIDVRNRVVLDSTPIADERVIDGIDGFVSLKAHKKAGVTDGSVPSPGSSIGTISPPARVVRNASLVHALAGRASD